MSDDSERDLLLYYLNIQYSNPKEVELQDEQQDNIKIIKRVVELDPNLSEDDRSILTMAYKNPVTSRRNSLRNVECIIQNEAASGDSNSYKQQRIDRLKIFEQKLKAELEELCLDLIKLVDEKILNRPSIDAEDRVFYEKMKGDFYRYICENRPRSEVDDYVNKAKQCYDNGLEISKAELSASNPTYLGLVLNYTVFLYDIMEMKEEAIELSKKTYTETADLIDTMDDTSYSESSMILQLLQNNCRTWLNASEQDM